jgi:hypothetical protein
MKASVAVVRDVRGTRGLVGAHRSPIETPLHCEVCTIPFFRRGERRRHGGDAQYVFATEQSRGARSEERRVGTAAECDHHTPETPQNVVESRTP